MAGECSVAVILTIAVNTTTLRRPHQRLYRQVTHRSICEAVSLTTRWKLHFGVVIAQINVLPTVTFHCHLMALHLVHQRDLPMCPSHVLSV